VLSAGENAASRLEESANVMKEIMETPDNAIPQELLQSCQCIVIVPGMKKAPFIIGAKYGKGFLLCRKDSGTGWSAPAAIMLEGGSFGFQLGGSSTDVVMPVMNSGGVDKLLSSKFTMGADASVAAGPVGKDCVGQDRSSAGCGDPVLFTIARIVCGRCSERRDITARQRYQYRAVRRQGNKQANRHRYENKGVGGRQQSDDGHEQVFDSE
jgi:lipid-binding SYLF domain-containing protein